MRNTNLRVRLLDLLGQRLKRERERERDRGMKARELKKPSELINSSYKNYACYGEVHQTIIRTGKIFTKK